jgi:hypothetical protein
MRYRTSLLLSPTDVGASGTKVIDLNFPDILSRLTILFSTTNPGTQAPIEHPSANVPKVEIVDGSNVIFSLTGMQAHALEFYDTGRLYQGGGSFVPAWNLVHNVVINFGRWLHDTVLGLDLKKFTNPQLKITFDEDAAVTATVENTLCVIADLFDELAATPTGFLMNKELYSYSPLAGATEEIDMPNDYPYRQILVQARVNSLWFGGIIDNVKLSEDNDKRIPLDLTGSQLESLNHALFPLCLEHIVADLDTTTGVTLFHAATQGILLRGDFYTTGGLIDNVPFGFSSLLKTTTQTGYQPMDIAGTMPHGVFSLPLGDIKDLTDVYDVKGKGLKLKIKAGSGKTFTETFHILTQQIRSY